MGLEPAFGESEESEPSKVKDTPAVYSISDINALIREMLEGQFQQIWVRGEISNFKPHTSGHYYFSLKDENSQISAVMFKGLNSKLKFKPENGLEVLVRGKVTVYEPRGNYQIFCETMEPVGAGALQKAFEQLKQKLQAEGLFDAKRKRAIPNFPKHIGLVTSPTGAAIRDILNVLKRRYKGARITLAPALVQGDPAPKSIVGAIQLINRLSDVDVLIVGRGGGSVEDLWAFNNEDVARAIAASRIPVISAVGHEVDFTIADFVADLRAPTPSAAAELVVKNAHEIAEKVQTLKHRLWQSLRNLLRTNQDAVKNYAKRLVDPKRKLEDLSMRCDELTLRLESAVHRYIDDQRRNVQLADVKFSNIVQKKLQKWRSYLGERMARLDAMSPLRVVERGYSIVESTTAVITDSRQVNVGDRLKLRLAKGSLGVEVKEIN